MPSRPVSKIQGVVFSIGCLLLLAVMGCGRSPAHPLAIGVVTQMPDTAPAYSGFKTGMADLGYVEGVDLEYIYREVSGDNEQLIGNTIKELLAQRVDLLLTFEYDITLKCKAIAKTVNLPILFISNPRPVEMGLVDSLSHPGGNLTGVRMPETTYKALEWLTIVVPRAKKIYLPYNPDYDITELEMSELKYAAANLGVELVFDQIHSVEETVAAIESLGKDIDAVFRIPSQTVNLDNHLITQAALNQGIPTCASLLLDEDVLMTFTGDFTVAGKQAARLANQIHKGVSPSNLPVETSDAFLIINLRTADKIGLSIPQEILSQAQTIIR